MDSPSTLVALGPPTEPTETAQPHPKVPQSAGLRWERKRKVTAVTVTSFTGNLS